MHRNVCNSMDPISVVEISTEVSEHSLSFWFCIQSWLSHTLLESSEVVSPFRVLGPFQCPLLGLKGDTSSRTPF